MDFDFNKILENAVNDDDLALYADLVSSIAWLLRVARPGFTSNGCKALIDSKIKELTSEAKTVRETLWEDSPELAKAI